MADVRTISKEDLKDKLDNKAPVQVINVLEKPEVGNLKLILGSKNIPLSELSHRLDELDKSKEVVVYCSSYLCTASKEAAKQLKRNGFKVKAYEGGLKEWTESGLPIV
ncbi:MAG: rhodanese-like domain-containing protein [Bacteriovoracia bacterium]